MKTQKITYTTPSIEIFFIEIEEGIAAASSTVSIGTPGQTYQPEVETWDPGSSSYTYGEF